MVIDLWVVIMSILQLKKKKTFDNPSSFFQMFSKVLWVLEKTEKLSQLSKKYAKASSKL